MNDSILLLPILLAYGIYKMTTLILYSTAIVHFILGAIYPAHLDSALIIGNIWIVGGILSSQIESK